MEDVAAFFSSFEQEVENRIAGMDREQLASIIRCIIGTARGIAKFGAMYPVCGEKQFLESRAIIDAVRTTLRISASTK